MPKFWQVGNITKILAGFLMYVPKFGNKLNVDTFLTTLPRNDIVKNGINLNNPSSKAISEIPIHWKFQQLESFSKWNTLRIDFSFSTIDFKAAYLFIVWLLLWIKNKKGLPSKTFAVHFIPIELNHQNKSFHAIWKTKTLYISSINIVSPS